MKLAPVYIRRLLTAALLAVAFVIMASVFDPGFTRAGQDTSVINQIDRSASTDPHVGLKSLGSLRSDRYVIQIYSTSQGPRYSVYDSSGNLLATLRTAAQVAEQFPGLPLPNLDADTPSDQAAPNLIMHADVPEGDL